MLLLAPGYSFLFGPLDVTAQLLPKQDAPLPDKWHSHFSGVSVPDLAPYIFEARVLGWSAITRCLEDGCF